MWKRMLVGLDGSLWSEAAASHAFDLARRFDAEVEGVYVSDVRLAAPPLPPADMLGAPLEVPAAPFAEVEGQDRKRGEAVLAAFVERARAAGVRALSALESGIPARVILARQRGADAVFLGRQGRGGAGDRSIGSTAREVIRESVRPVLIACLEVRELRRVLVAYDGSPESTRAVRVACELSDLGVGFDYVLLTVGDDEQAAEATQRDAVTYFAAHGIKPDRALRCGPPAGTIVATAQALRCDLIVAGGFGKSRLKEMLLGSVTRELLRQCHLPVLMLH